MLDTRAAGRPEAAQIPPNAAFFLHAMSLPQRVMQLPLRKRERTGAQVRKSADASTTIAVPGGPVSRIPPRRSLLAFSHSSTRKCFLALPHLLGRGNDHLDFSRAQRRHQLSRGSTIGDDGVHTIQITKRRDRLASELCMVEAKDHFLRRVDH